MFLNFTTGGTASSQGSPREARKQCALAVPFLWVWVGSGLSYCLAQLLVGLGSVCCRASSPEPPTVCIISFWILGK